MGGHSGRNDSPKKFFGAISDRHPIVLNDDSLHSVWVNSPAIAAAKLDAKAPMLARSGWPAAMPDQNPLVGVEALVTRRDPRGQTAGALWPEQAVTLEETLRLYALESAKTLRLERTTGSIEVGTSADFVVLDRNLLAVPIEDVGDTQVRSTWFEGKLVYEAPN
jgi:predicted amidohydrolase YtcJ